MITNHKYDYTLWFGSGREVLSALRKVLFALRKVASSGSVFGGRMSEYRTLSSSCEGGLTFMWSRTVSTAA